MDYERFEESYLDVVNFFKEKETCALYSSIYELIINTEKRKKKQQQESAT